MSAAKKNKLKLYGLSLVHDQLQANKKKRISRISITEHSNLGNLSERLDWKNSFHIEEGCNIDDKYKNTIGSLRFDLSIPPRVIHSNFDKEEYRMIEFNVFNRWKQLHGDKVFERNIEIWRQFWIVCERSDILVQIVDARNIDFFINNDIFTMYPDKRHVIFCNKADLITDEMRNRIQDQIKQSGKDVHLYSSKDDMFDFKLCGYVGLIGYPNVGKSSTINLIIKKKKVRVSSTPGKTKHIQTIKTDDFVINDCPGLVFPKHTKIDLIINGVINVDQVIELMKYENDIIERIGKEKIKRFYNIECENSDLLSQIRHEKSIIKSDCLKMIIKDFINGDLK